MARHKALRLRRTFWHGILCRSVDPDALADIAVAPERNGNGHVVSLPALLGHLDGRELVVVRLRLGRRAFREIGEMVGVSEDNAAQIHHRAVAKLRAVHGREARPCNGRFLTVNSDRLVERRKTNGVSGAPQARPVSGPLMCALSK